MEPFAFLVLLQSQLHTPAAQVPLLTALPGSRLTQSKSPSPQHSSPGPTPSVPIPAFSSSPTLSPHSLPPATPASSKFLQHTRHSLRTFAPATPSAHRLWPLPPILHWTRGLKRVCLQSQSLPPPALPSPAPVLLFSKGLIAI